MMGFNRRTPWQCKTAALARLWRQKGVNVLATSDIRPPYRYLSGCRRAWGLARRAMGTANNNTHRVGGNAAGVVGPCGGC